MIPEAVASLTGSDYELRNDAGQYTWSTSPRARTWGLRSQAARRLAGLDFSGLDGLGSGQSVFVYPTRYAAAELGVAIDDPRRVAAAAPVVASMPATNAGPRVSPNSA